MRYFFREWRQAAGLSLLDLADILGISEGQVSKIETNKRDFTGDYLVDFATVVGCKQICDPLCRPPQNFKNRVGTLNPIEKLAIERRLQNRSKEIRKLRRGDRSQGGGSRLKGNSPSTTSIRNDASGKKLVAPCLPLWQPINPAVPSLKCSGLGGISTRRDIALF